MPRSVLPLVLAFLTLIGCAGCASASREIDEKSAELVSRANKGDVETLIREYYTAEPIIAFAGQGVTKSREEGREKFREMLERGTIELTTHRTEESGDLFVQMGRWKLRILAGPGDFREEDGGYFAVWKRERGQWRVAMQSFAPEGFREND